MNPSTVTTKYDSRKFFPLTKMKWLCLLMLFMLLYAFFGNYETYEIETLENTVINFDTFA